MPPIRIKKFSNEITKGIARDNNVHMLYHIHRRQEDFNNNHKINPTSVPSIPTVSLPHGSISLTLPIPSSGSPNDTKSNNLHVWMFSILAVAILIMILTVLALIYKKRKGKRNTLHSINAGDITDKDKENSSKSNSLTSSINSISSSFKIKKGKIVPGDIHVSSPPVPSIVEEKPHMPTLKRTQTTVSAFQELVDLTDDEHFNLRKSTSSGIYTIASRLSSTPTYVNYDAEEGSSSNVTNVIPLNQERIDTIIPHSNADSGGGDISQKNIIENFFRENFPIN
ncbi:15426_t:CDS:2 [Rhizophagus irregularis]|nr:15426_t:CDS:2 [Rhizophagus irregularis]